MLSKQPCQHCGTNIEFDANEVSGEGETVACPKCQEAVPLLRPPPVVAPAVMHEGKRRRYPVVWVVATSVATLATVLFLIVVASLNSEAGYAIVPEPYYNQKLIVEPLDRFAFNLGVKELNTLFYKHGDFIFVNVFREPSVHPTFRLSAIDRYIQGKRVVYTFSSIKLSEADLMNGWEFKGDVEFLVTGSKRTYNPEKDREWSEWTMSPGDHGVQNSLYGTTLRLRILKKKGGAWEVIQQDSINREMVRPLSREKVEELLRLPSRN